MTRLRRLLHHWRSSKRQGCKLFPANALDRFQSIIEEGTHRHRAQLKLAIEVAMPARAILSNASARSRACTILELHRTVDETECSHVLIYINLADRKVECVADAAVTQALTAEQWNHLCRHITNGFSSGDPCNGIENALKQFNTFMERALPEIIVPVQVVRP